MTPKQLLKAAKKEHPRAAFYSIISQADQDIGKSRNLQAFALAERTQGSE